MEAWWAAIYGVAQSWTRLKRLSSSSSSSSSSFSLTVNKQTQNEKKQTHIRQIVIVKLRRKIEHTLIQALKFPKSTSILECWLYASRTQALSVLLLLLLLSCFSRVWLCATPETAAYQAPPSLGFSRQGHWSGLPFPSPPWVYSNAQNRAVFAFKKCSVLA